MRSVYHTIITNSLQTCNPSLFLSYLSYHIISYSSLLSSYLILSYSFLSSLLAALWFFFFFFFGGVCCCPDQQTNKQQQVQSCGKYTHTRAPDLKNETEGSQEKFDITTVETKWRRCSTLSGYHYRSTCCCCSCASVRSLGCFGSCGRCLRAMRSITWRGELWLWIGRKKSNLSAEELVDETTELLLLLLLRYENSNPMVLWNWFADENLLFSNKMEKKRMMQVDLMKKTKEDRTTDPRNEELEEELSDAWEKQTSRSEDDQSESSKSLR